MFKIGGNLDDGPFDLAVDRQIGILTAILFFGSHNIIVYSDEGSIVFYESSTIFGWVHGILEETDVLELGVLDVGMGELIIVQVENLHVSEDAELEGHFSQEVAGQIQLYETGAFRNGG